MKRWLPRQLLTPFIGLMCSGLLAATPAPADDVAQASGQNDPRPEATPTFTAPVYRKTTLNKTFDEVIDDLLIAISENNFRLTEQAKIGQAIADREQIDFPRVTVLHFCNLTYAREFIATAPEAILHMPCRIAVRQIGNEIVIETLLLDETLAPEASIIPQVNSILQAIVNSGAS